MFVDVYFKQKLKIFNSMVWEHVQMPTFFYKMCYISKITDEKKWLIQKLKRSRRSEWLRFSKAEDFCLKSIYSSYVGAYFEHEFENNNIVREHAHNHVLRLFSRN